MWKSLRIGKYSNIKIKNNTTTRTNKETEKDDDMTMHTSDVNEEGTGIIYLSNTFHALGPQLHSNPDLGTFVLTLVNKN